MPPPQAYPQQPQDQYPQAQGQPPGPYLSNRASIPSSRKGSILRGSIRRLTGWLSASLSAGAPSIRPLSAAGIRATAAGLQPAPAACLSAGHGPVTIPQGTLLQLRTSEGVATRNAKDGQPVQFTLITDVTDGGVLAIPRGATLHGVVTESKKAGELGGSAVLALTLTSLDLGGQSYQLSTDQFKVKGPNKAGETVGNTVGGAVIGTIIGCAVGRGAGCAIGAGAGALGGAAATAATPGPGVWIPAEALVTFHLDRAHHRQPRKPAGSRPSRPGPLSRRTLALPSTALWQSLRTSLLCRLPLRLPARLLPPLLLLWRL